MWVSSCLLNTFDNCLMQVCVCIECKGSLWLSVFVLFADVCERPEDPWSDIYHPQTVRHHPLWIWYPSDGIVSQLVWQCMSLFVSVYICVCVSVSVCQSGGRFHACQMVWFYITFHKGQYLAYKHYCMPILAYVKSCGISLWKRTRSSRDRNFFLTFLNKALVVS